MADYSVRPATLFDIVYISENLRECDRVEADLMGQSISPVDRAVITMQASSCAFVGTVDGIPALAFGTIPTSMVNKSAAAWMFGTDQIYQHRRAVIRRRHDALARMTKGWDRIGNAVHAENALAIAFLKSMKFKIGPARRMFSSGAMFHPFFWEREDA